MESTNDDVGATIDWGALANTAFSYIPRGGSSSPTASPPNSQAPAQVSTPPKESNTMMYVGIGLGVLVLVIVLIKR